MLPKSPHCQNWFDHFFLGKGGRVIRYHFFGGKSFGSDFLSLFGVNNYHLLGGTLWILNVKSTKTLAPPPTHGNAKILKVPDTTMRHSLKCKFLQHKVLCDSRRLSVVTLAWRRSFENTINDTPPPLLIVARSENHVTPTLIRLYTPWHNSCIYFCKDCWQYLSSSFFFIFAWGAATVKIFSSRCDQWLIFWQYWADFLTPKSIHTKLAKLTFLWNFSSDSFEITFSDTRGFPATSSTPNYRRKFTVVYF